MGELRGRREEGRSTAAASSRVQMPAWTTPEKAASSIADLLCLLAGDAQLDAQGSAHLALIRDLLEPFAAGRTDQALTVICQRVAALMGVPQCSLFLWDEASGCLVLVAQAGAPNAPLQMQPAPPTTPDRLPDWVREMERLGHSVAPPRPSRLQRRRRRARSLSDAAGLPWDAYPVLGIPLWAGGRAIGFLFCEGTGHSAAFTERHTRLGNILAATLAPAIGAAWTNRRDPPEDPLSRSTRLALSGSLDPDEVLQLVSEMARERLGAQVCVALSFQDARSFRVRIAAEWEDADIGIDLIGDGLASQALRLGRAVWISDCVRPPRILPREVAARVPLRSGIAVPLQEGDQVTGAILAYHSLRRDYSADEVRLLASLAAQAGAALRNCVLYERQRLVAETVQRALAPRLPPIVEGGGCGAALPPESRPDRGRSL
jgi:GAF domain-containing protein